MPQFIYSHRQEMPARPGVKYATVYIKQRREHREQLFEWITHVAQQTLVALAADPDLAEWFETPLRNFRRSQPGKYYSAQDLLTDMLAQLAQGRDLPEAMLNRWNRLTESTPWQIDLVDTIPAPTGARVANNPQWSSSPNRFADVFELDSHGS